MKKVTKEFKNMGKINMKNFHRKRNKKKRKYGQYEYLKLSANLILHAS